MSATLTPLQPGTSGASRIVRRIATARETGIAVALVLVIVAATASNPTFLFSSDGFRDLLLTPSLLIIDEPTRGIDIGTKAEVHRLISELAGQGMAILMISSELPEVLGMADRVLVVHEGHITANLDRADATPESVMTAATNTMEVSA
jgi:hypothetical protein